MGKQRKLKEPEAMLEGFRKLSPKLASRYEKIPIKPKSFEKLTEIVISGKYTDLEHLKRVFIEVFSEFEEIFSKMNINPYCNTYDPNKPDRYEDY